MIVSKETRGRKVVTLCPATGELAQVSPQAAELAHAMSELPREDQALMISMVNMMAAGTWPYSPEEVTSWTPAQFRAAMATLTAPQ